MRYSYDFSDRSIRFTDTSGFSIGQILECGQCFRFAKAEAGDEAAVEYVIAARGKVLHVRQEGAELSFFPTSPEEFDGVWRGYFDLDTDYGLIARTLSEKDEWLKEAAALYGGIRILNQEPWECLISFIISQQSQIPRIKKVIENLSRAFGEPIGDGFHAFPSPERLAAADLDGIAACRTGFRARYILDAARKVASGQIDLDRLAALDSVRARQALMTIVGVGEKIADCVMLFSLGKKDVFPTDVWIGRVMRRFYFNDAPESAKKIREFAARRFGEYAGVAQEYLYAYARERRIGGRGEQGLS